MKGKTEKRKLTFHQFFLLFMIMFSLFLLYEGFRAFLRNDMPMTIVYAGFGLVSLVLSVSSLMRIRSILTLLESAVPKVTTVIECSRCGFRSFREFEQADFIFKRVGECPKCKRTMYITSIYREVRRGKTPTL
jgi:predicted nucleic-acid-binding Zn-ribbon protein